MLHRIVLLLLSVLVGLSQGSRCRLPWTGVWLENGSELNITHNSIGNLGNCVHKSRDLYLLTSDTSRGPCYRCLITFPVHENVLHYKTTQCIFDQEMSLEKCSQLMSADTTMHTLFRKEAIPVPCPIEAPMNFTYQTNQGICNSRTSHLHRCAQYDRLALHYQACPEIPNRESAIWQMECIGSWQSFGSFYFAARVGYSAGEQYRCFIHDKTGSSGRIGESADAGCQELTHIGAAATTLHYRQDSPVHSGCEFPENMYGENARNWESMLLGTYHRMYHGSWISSVKGRNDTVWTCLQQFATDSTEHFTYRTYVTKGCKVGYQCVRFHMRKPHIVHVQYGEISASESFADCSEFPIESRDTLILHGSKEACPIGGKHYSAQCQMPILQVGCQSKYSMTLIRDCLYPDGGDDMTCVANFKHEGNDFIIARDSLSRQLFCMTYISDRINLLRVYDRVSCEDVSVNSATPYLSLNFSSSDSCSPSLLTGFLYSATSDAPFSFQSYHFLITLLLLLLLLH